VSGGHHPTPHDAWERLTQSVATGRPREADVAATLGVQDSLRSLHGVDVR